MSILGPTYSSSASLDYNILVIHLWNTGCPYFRVHPWINTLLSSVPELTYSRYPPLNCPLRLHCLIIPLIITSLHKSVKARFTTRPHSVSEPDQELPKASNIAPMPHNSVQQTNAHLFNSSISGALGQLSPSYPVCLSLELSSSLTNSLFVLCFFFFFFVKNSKSLATALLLTACLKQCVAWLSKSWNGGLTGFIVRWSWGGFVVICRLFTEFFGPVLKKPGSYLKLIVPKFCQIYY